MRYIALYPSPESVYFYYKRTHEIKADLIMIGDNLRAPRNELIYLYCMHVLKSCQNADNRQRLCSTNHNKIELKLGIRTDISLIHDVWIYDTSDPCVMQYQAFLKHSWDDDVEVDYMFRIMSLIKMITCLSCRYWKVRELLLCLYGLNTKGCQV